jgi:hypothetical protein
MGNGNVFRKVTFLPLSADGTTFMENGGCPLAIGRELAIGPHDPEKVETKSPTRSPPPAWLKV